MLITLHRYILALFLILAASQAHATFRCGVHLIEEGAQTVEVERICGPPAQKEVRRPVMNRGVDEDYEGATVEVWVYGPKNGVYRHLRFVNGNLVKIWSVSK